MKKFEEVPQKDISRNSGEDQKDSDVNSVNKIGFADSQDNKMSLLEPPTFISDDKTYDVYKKDLERWARLTSLDKKLHAEMVVYKLGNHPSWIQEKIRHDWVIS